METIPNVTVGINVEEIKVDDPASLPVPINRECWRVRRQEQVDDWYEFR